MKSEMSPYQFELQSDEESLTNVRGFYEFMNRRRSVREFSAETIPGEVIKNAIMAASTAPSGANKQPWTYCVITNKTIKSKIRAAAEKEEYENYHGRMSDQWLKDLEEIGTDHIKEFLDVAPCLIVVFKRIYEQDKYGSKLNNYYVNESVGISVGVLLAALHTAGLASLTHTPSPMNFLAEILQRPKNERAFLLIPVGYPASDVAVPNIKRKDLSEIMVQYV